MVRNAFTSWKCVTLLLITAAQIAGAQGAALGQAPQVAPATASPPRAAAAALSEDECRAFADRFAAAVNSGDGAKVTGLIDWDAVLETATSGVPTPDAVRRTFSEGVKGSMAAPEGLGAQLAQIPTRGGSYRVLRVPGREGPESALFRMTLPNMSGLNYHDMKLDRRSDGQIRIVDMFIYVAGERISETVRRAYLPTAANASRGLLERLSGKESLFVKHLPEIEKLSLAGRAGRHQEVLNIYKQLPPELHSDKNLLIMRLRAAQAISLREYAQALGDLKANFGVDPSIELLAIDGYMLKLQHSEALACVNRLDDTLGGDGYLNVIRASIYIARENLEQARAMAAKAIEQEPTMTEGYWMAIRISLKDQNFADTAMLLDKIATTFQIVVGDLSNLPEYGLFVKSPEYQQWRESKRHEVAKPVTEPGGSK